MSETVREVKRRVLNAFKAWDCLSGTIILSFIVSLRDHILLGDHGIPDDSLIIVKTSTQMQRSVWLACGPLSSLYRFAPSDMIEDLEAAVRPLREPGSRDFVLVVDSEPLQGKDRLTWLILDSSGGFEVDLLEIFRFECHGESIAFPLGGDVAVGGARKAFGSHLGINPDWARLKSGEELSTPIWRLTGSLQFICLLPFQRFQFFDRKFILLVDPLHSIEALTLLFERELGVRGAFTLTCRGDQARREMTLADLEPGPGEVIELAVAAPTVIQIVVTVFIGVIPRVLALSLLPEATIADAEVNLGDLQLAFALMEMATESTATLAKPTAVADLELSHLRLFPRSERCP